MSVVKVKLALMSAALLAHEQDAHVRCQRVNRGGYTLRVTVSEPPPQIGR